MNEQNLILVLLYDPAQFRPAANKIALVELAFEYRILKVVAEPAHSLEYFAQPPVVSYVVANQIRLPHILNNT